MFVCDECDHVSRDKQLATQHQEVVHDGRILRCPYDGCESTFRAKANRSEHVKSIHNTETFNCKECDYIGRSKITLRKHFGIHHGVKYFACEFCEFRAGYQYLIDRHIRGNHVHMLTEKQKINLKVKKCQSCNYESYTAKVREHERICDGKDRRVRTSSYKYQSQKCDYQTDITEKLNYHVSDRHSNNPIFCNSCDFSAGFKSSIRQHRKISHQIFQCNSCTYSGKYQSFILHLRTKHGVSEKKLAINDQTCEICKEVPTTKLYFKIHCYWRHSKDEGEGLEVKRKKAQNLQKIGPLNCKECGY